MIATARHWVLIRSAVLWCTTTAAAAGLIVISAPALAASPHLLTGGPAFADLLVTACAAATVVAAGWLWAITTDVVIRVVGAGGSVAVRRPGRMRLLLLAACGAVVLSATAAPASADDHRPVFPRSLAGLPLPDRAISAGPLLDSADVAPPSTRVRSGDSLWSIAEAHLGPTATVSDVVDYWHRIYDRNADVIGPDPDLILPGDQLELPPTD